MSSQNSTPQTSLHSDALTLYPAIDLISGKCVRLQQGDYNSVTTYGDDPVEMAHRWKQDGASWLHIVDLDGAKAGVSSEENRRAIRNIAREVGLPIQCGGGIRNEAAVERALEDGVSRVVIGTAASRDPVFAAKMFASHGEKIAVGVDARNGVVAVQGWQEHDGEEAGTFVKRMADLGATRFIFTDIARDGMLQGVNLAALAAVAMTVPTIAVVASGGVADVRDIIALHELKAKSAPNLDGVIIGKALYAGTLSLREALGAGR